MPTYLTRNSARWHSGPYLSDLVSEVVTVGAAGGEHYRWHMHRPAHNGGHRNQERLAGLCAAAGKHNPRAGARTPTCGCNGFWPPNVLLALRQPACWCLVQAVSVVHGVHGEATDVALQGVSLHYALQLALQFYGHAAFNNFLGVS